VADFHNDALQALYSCVIERAGTLAHLSLHSPGSAAKKTVDGKTYTNWRVYLASGKHKETSLVRAGEPAMEVALEAKLPESACPDARRIFWRTLRLSRSSLLNTCRLAANCLHSSNGKVSCPWARMPNTFSVIATSA
jgi:hypothetical protein